MPSSAVRPIGHEDRLSIVEHLDELRRRLIASLIVFFVCFGVAYSFNGRLLTFVNQPLQDTQNLDGNKPSKDPLEQSANYQIQIGKALEALGPALNSVDGSLHELGTQEGVDPVARASVARAQRQLKVAVATIATAQKSVPTSRARLPVTLGVTEPFVTTFTVAGYAALLLAAPFLLFQLYAFVLPAFSPKERKTALPLMLMVPFLFIAGVVFGYYVALPRAIGFLQNFNDDQFDILIQAKDYYRFSILLMAVVGLLFQIPVGVLAVTRLGIISSKQLRANRGYVILGLAIVAAVATPTPDPVTMLVALAPLLILFEFSLVLARIFEKRQERQIAEDEALLDDEDDIDWDDGEDDDDPDDDGPEDDSDPRGPGAQRSVVAAHDDYPA